MSDSAGPSSPRPQQTDIEEDPSRNKRKDKLILTPEEEQDIANWFRENELFYDKTRKDYTDSKVKQRILDEKAATLNPPRTGLQLKTWLDSMRTSAGKLIKQGPSGTAKLNPTVKEKWICQNFGFLIEHIRRVPSRQAINVSSIQIL